jgi:hypothetical protein
MPKIWTKEEIVYLRDNAILGSNRIAVALKRTRSQVVMKAYVERISLATNGQRGRPFNPNLIVDTKRHRKGTQLPKIIIKVFGEESLLKWPMALGVNQRLWMKRRAIVLKMHDNACYYCGDPANTVDHIKPRHLGGTDHIHNLVAACMDCNYGWIQQIPWHDKYLKKRLQGV